MAWCAGCIGVARTGQKTYYHHIFYRYLAPNGAKMIETYDLIPANRSRRDQILVEKSRKRDFRAVGTKPIKYA